MRTTGEAKYVKMLHWLRKRGKGDSLDIDLAWLRLLRSWFSVVVFTENHRVAVDSVQRILASAGLKIEPEVVVRCLETHDLTVGGGRSTFFGFVEFMLDVDKEGVSRALAAQKLSDTSLSLWPPHYSRYSIKGE